LYLSQFYPLKHVHRSASESPIYDRPQLEDKGDPKVDLEDVIVDLGVGLDSERASLQLRLTILDL